MICDNIVRMKTSTKILITLVIVLSLVAFLLVDSFFLAPSRFITRKETLQNNQIQEQLDGMNILFFSDLEYGTFMKEERLERLIETINQCGADVVIFGGDIYDETVTSDETSIATIQKAFASIQAKYGKFAVYGDNDCQSDEMKNAVNQIYANSDFEVIENTSFSIHKNGSQFITLVGLDNQINGVQDIDGAYANVSQDSYVITICHTPDTAVLVPQDLTDYFLAGHSHGGQSYFLFTASYQPASATQYLRGKHTIQDSFTLDITNGTGTTGQDVRFLTPAEVVLYTLKSTKATETSTPETKLQTQSSSND